MSLLLKTWMDKATSAQQTTLAELAGVSRGYLYRIAQGRGKASADVAGRIEHAAEVMSQTQSIPTLLPRYFLSPSCNNCPYARKCTNLTVNKEDK